MRIAIIDLGTNSVRFDIHQLGPKKGSVRQLHREKIMVRLGQGVFLNGKLDRSAVQRTLQAFTRFKKSAAQFKAAKIIAFGTSALRECSDGERFLRLVHERTGIQIRVISGSEEAQLIALGILSNEKTPKGKYALVDIGGGSTEISICRGKAILHSFSFPLGTARLQQVFLKKSPPAAASIQELREFIQGTLSSVILSEHWPKVDQILGSSGTIRALAKILEGSEWDEFRRDDLSDLVDEMSSMTTTELLGIDGIESKRVDMILAGAVLFEEIMYALSARKATPTEFSLRDGILEEELRLFEKGDTSHLALHLPDLLEKALQFGADQAHLNRMLEFSGQVFDGLRPVHRLDSCWKLYLQAATLLRDTGKAISLAGHSEHSYYIVKHADFPAADSWETDFIADLCHYHEGAKLDLSKLSFEKDKERVDAFRKLLAMLRVIDALDSGPETSLKLKGIQRKRSQVILKYSGKGLTGLESLNVEKKAPFFEKVMGSSIKAN
jgi:exopolyphosphatase/guanosine-5'-triphosphate,3'-diphosphate pyrophosphatase